MKRISVIGGDLRQVIAAKLFQDDGYDVLIYGFSECEEANGLRSARDLDEAMRADIILLPMPVSPDGKELNAPFFKSRIDLAKLCAKAPADALILGGRMDKEIFKNKRYSDYAKREEMMIKNAVPTAEGAIEIAIEETPRTLAASRCLITGYGRIGKVLSKRLADMGADVAVSARKYSDLAWIEVNGYKAVHKDDIIKNAGEYDIIFNTVPAMVIGEDVLKRTSEDAVIIDLASKPGGVDLSYAQKTGRKVIWALSLPGKCAPVTAGHIIKDTAENIIREEV